MFQQHLKAIDDTDGESKIKSKFGASLNSGRTFFLNQEPIVIACPLTLNTSEQKELLNCYPL